MIILRKLIFFVYCGGIYNNRVQQFVNFGAPSFVYPRKCEDFLLQNRLVLRFFTTYLNNINFRIGKKQ